MLIFEFAELGILIDSEIDYRALAKFMVASEQSESEYSMKKEVVINDASIKEGILSGYAYDHPKLEKAELIHQPFKTSLTMNVQLYGLKQKILYLLSVQPAGKFDLNTIHSIIHIQLGRR